MKTEIRVAIADDHDLYRHGLADFFNSLGCIVTCHTPNGQSLINALETAEELPDVCILDIYMPILDGIETGKIIRKKWPDIHVIATSMRDDATIIPRLDRAKIRSWVLKSEHEKLRDAVLRTPAAIKSRNIKICQLP